jgi:hypothetical protein
MKFYDFFLKLYGLQKIISLKEFKYQTKLQNNEDIIIEIDETNTIKRNNVNIQKTSIFSNILINILNYFYMAFIFSILLFPLITSIVLASIYQDGRYFTACMFPIMYFLQYLTGIIFYKKEFYKIAMKNMKDHHGIFLLLYISALILSTAIATSSLIFLYHSLNINVYTKLLFLSNYSQQIILSFSLFIDKFFSYNIYFINLITFVSILTVLKNKINTYKKKLKIIIDNNNNITICDMVKEYIELQEYHKKSVNSLNNIFTTITIFGLIGCYFTIINFNTDFIGVFDYINVAFYIIIDCIYFYSINQIQNITSDIKVIIGSSKFVIKFLTKSDLVSVTGDIYDDYNLDKKNKDKNKNIDKKLDIIKNISYRNVILSNEISVDLDWIILYNKLLEPWECFSVFGFAIDDTALLQKFISIVLGLLGILQLNIKIFGIDSK